jgi:arginine:pyruvate transaminase
VVGAEPLRDACQRIARCAHELMEAQLHA